MDPVTKLVVASIAVGDGANAVAVGAGAVGSDRLAGTVVRIDPATNSVKTTIPVGHSPTDIAVGLGTVWSQTAATAPCPGSIPYTTRS